MADAWFGMVLVRAPTRFEAARTKGGNKKNAMYNSVSIYNCYDEKIMTYNHVCIPKRGKQSMYTNNEELFESFIF